MVPPASSGRPASDQAAAAVAELGRTGIMIGEFAFGQPSLDEVFMTLTGQRATCTSAAAGAGTRPAGAQVMAASSPAAKRGSS